MLKILTTRLTKVIKEHDILQGRNFAALEGSSCFEPIKMVHMILEDAKIQRKQCWMLLMDISKAYDSVSGWMLEKALNRIGITGKLARLIMLIFKNRTNRVLVNNDTTAGFKVEDGLDQGEVWSPILWRIFFDPLLCKLKEVEYEWNYTLQGQEIININNKVVKQEKFKINHVAFMDDANLIASSKEQIINLYKICNSFFKMCEIQCNPNKYELLGINCPEGDENRTILIGENKVKINTSDKGARFLGV